MIDISNLEAVTAFLNDLKARWYVNAGMALYLYGLPGDLSDVDIRVHCSDLAELSATFSEKFKDKVYLRPPLDYKYGKYDTLCIELSQDVKYDIYSKMRIVREGLGVVDFPFDEESFSNNQIITYEGVELSVASLECLLAYYVVLRRNSFDVATIMRITNHKSFSPEAFEAYIKKFDKYDEIKAICDEAILSLPK